MSADRGGASSSWRDVVRWFWDVCGPFIKGGIGPVLGSAGVVIVAGRTFVTTPHEVPGWMIVVAAGIGGLCVVSVGLHIKRWLRRGGSLVIEHTSGPVPPHWGLGSEGIIPLMFVTGRFHA